MKNEFRTPQTFNLLNLPESKSHTVAESVGAKANYVKIAGCFFVFTF